jgi:hypothetical protein
MGNGRNSVTEKHEWFGVSLPIIHLRNSIVSLKKLNVKFNGIKRVRNQFFGYLSNQSQMENNRCHITFELVLHTSDAIRIIVAELQCILPEVKQNCLYSFLSQCK